MSNTLISKLKKIRLLVLDFDGVFTDGKVYINQDGVESVVCSRRDSLGLNLLRQRGIKLSVVTAETNPVVVKRCEKLKIELIQSQDKLASFKNVISREGLKSDQAAYMGDDINDLECLKYAGFSFTVKDGAPECLKAAGYITKRKSGDHALREVCDLILSVE